MAVGLVITPLVSALTSKPDKKKIEEIFSCYETKTVVSAKHSVGYDGNGK